MAPLRCFLLHSVVEFEYSFNLFYPDAYEDVLLVEGLLSNCISLPRSNYTTRLTCAAFYKSEYHLPIDQLIRVLSRYTLLLLTWFSEKLLEGSPNNYSRLSMLIFTHLLKQFVCLSGILLVHVSYKYKQISKLIFMTI